MYIFLYILRFCSRILSAANGRAPCSIAGALQMAPRSMASLELKAPSSLAPSAARAAALAIQKCSFRNSHVGPGVCRHKMALLPTLGTHFTCFTGKKKEKYRYKGTHSDAAAALAALPTAGGTLPTVGKAILVAGGAAAHAVWQPAVRQYLYFGTSKASKLSTPPPAAGWRTVEEAALVQRNLVLSLLALVVQKYEY